MALIYIGPATLNSNNQGIAVDTMKVGPIALREDANIIAISFRSGTGNGGIQVQGGIYTKDPITGKPGTLVATTSVRTGISGSSATNDVNFAAPVALPAGDYFAGIVASAGFSIRGVSNENLNYQMAAPFGSGPPATFDSAATQLGGTSSFGLKYDNAGSTLDAYTFGGVGSTGTSASYSNGQKIVSRFTLAERATVDRLTAGFTLATTGAARLVIYADSGGAPGALVAVSNTKVGIARYGNPQDFFLPAPVILEAGDYWLGYHSGVTSLSVSLELTGSGYGSSGSHDDFSDGTSDPFGPGASISRTVNVYAPYTPTPSVAGGTRSGRVIWFGL